MGITDLLFPKCCLSCGRPGLYLCSTCMGKVPYRKQKCLYCAKPSIDGFTHAKCLRRYRVNGSFTVWRHEGVVRETVLKIKYKFLYDAGSELADLVSRHLKDNFSALPKNSILTPVPLHSKRLRWRGFNQSEKLGRILSGKMGWGFIPDMLIKTANTRPQMELKRNERLANLKNVFAFNSVYRPLTANETDLIVFDDVLTTGSTIKEAGKTLKRAGFKNVWGLTVAG